MAEGEQVTITLPPGVSKDAYLKSHAAWENQRVATALRDKATRNAQARMKAKYPEDFDKFYAEEYKKVSAAPKV